MLLKNHSYSERANWVEFITTLGVLYYYIFRGVPSLPGFFESYPAEFGELFIGVIIVSIILGIIIAGIFGLGNDKHSSVEDERDIQIRRKATSWVYWILNIGITYLFVQLFINTSVRAYVEGDVSKFGLFMYLPSIDFMLHGLILLAFITQIAQNLIEIYFQRRGF